MGGIEVRGGVAVAERGREAPVQGVVTGEGGGDRRQAAVAAVSSFESTTTTLGSVRLISRRRSEGSASSATRSEYAR